MTDEDSTTNDAEEEQEMTTDEVEIVEDAEDLDLEARAEQAVEQANAIHQRIAAFKEWSVETAADIRTRAQLLHEMDELTEDERDELQAQAQQIRTVYQRLNVD